MKPLVSIIMGSRSDWEAMSRAQDILNQLKIPNEAKVFSAHRTPDLLFEYLAPLPNQGVEVIIAGAGMAAHLPGVIAGKCHLPVIGVPMIAKGFGGMDALLAISQMPAGTPVATMSVGGSGATNAGLYAASILGIKYPEIREAYLAFREAQIEKGRLNSDPAADPV